MLDENSPMTLQYQLRMALLQKIESKEWPPGSKIPSERELCNEYGVSRMTVREVLKELVHERCLVRKQGIGTFVAIPQFGHEFTSYFSLSQEIEKEGLDSRFELQELKLEYTSPHLAEVFGEEASDRTYVISRLRYIGKTRFAWEVSYVPYELLRDVTVEQLETEGLYFSIYRQSGLMAEEAEVESEAVNCPGDIAEQLQIKKRQAVLHMLSTARGQGRILAYTESYVRSDLYKYKYKQILRKRRI